MIKLIRQYTQTVKIYSIPYPTLGKECIVTITKKDNSNVTPTISISVEGYELEDAEEREQITTQITQYENEQKAENGIPIAFKMPMYLSLDTRRAAVTALHITIQQFWKQRKSPAARGYVKQSVKAIREIYRHERNQAG